jgi:hypothetical protein
MQPAFADRAALDSKPQESFGNVCNESSPSHPSRYWKSDCTVGNVLGKVARREK